jgi:hypothetical protein
VPLDKSLKVIRNVEEIASIDDTLAANDNWGNVDEGSKSLK